MKKNQQILWIVGAIILAIIFINNSQLGTIFLTSEQIQYNNKPIIVQFTTQNFTNPTLKTYFNNIELTPYSGGNETIRYTNAIINGTYTVRIEGITSEGILTITLTESNVSESQSIEIKNPFVDIKYSIPTIVEKGSVTPLEITTLTPQGEDLEADNVLVDVYDPNNQKNTITFAKLGNKFSDTFIYSTPGNYQFKIHASKVGYTTREVTVITSVTKTEGVHPIIWVWAGFGILFIGLILFKLARRRRWI